MASFAVSGITTRANIEEIEHSDFFGLSKPTLSTLTHTASIRDNIRKICDEDDSEPPRGRT